MDFIQFDDSAIVKLREEIASLGTEIANTTAEAQALNDAIAGSGKDKMSEADKQTKKLEVLKDKLGELENKQKSVETGFTKGVKAAKGFNDALGVGISQNIGAFEGLGDIVEGVTGIIPFLGAALNGLSVAFRALAAAIIANPIILLGAVLIGVVAALGFLLVKLGVLKLLFDGISAVLGAIVQGFQNLTDFLGFTSFAAQKTYDTISKNEEDLRKELEESTKTRVELAEITEGLSEDQIEQIEKVTGVEINALESADSVRLESNKKLLASLDTQINALKELETKKGKLSKDEQKSLDELTSKYQSTSIDIVKIETKRAKELLDLEERNQNRRLELFGTAEEKLEAERKKIQEKTAKNLGDIIKQQRDLKQEPFESDEEFKQRGDDLQNLFNAYYEEQQLNQDEADKKLRDLQKSNYEKSKGDTEKAIAERKASAQKQLDEIRKEEELKILLTKEGTRENLIAQQEALTRIFIFQEANRKALGLTVADYELAAGKTTVAINKLGDDIIALDNKSKLSITDKAEIEKLAFEASEKERQKDLKNQERWVEDVITNVQVLADQGLFNLERILGDDEVALENKIKAVDEVLALQKTALEAARSAEVAAAEALGLDTQAIKEKYRQADIIATENAEKTKKELKEKNSEEEKKQLIKGLSFALEVAEDSFKFASAFSDLLFTVKRRNLEAGSKEDEKYAKKQFEVNKALGIGSAIINGLQSILAITATASDPTGITTALRIGTQIALTAGTIAKIAATKYKSTSLPGVTPPSPPNTNSGSGATPAFNLFGQGNNQNTVGATPNTNTVGGNNVFRVTAVVSETEITSTQNRIRRIQENSEL